MPPKPKFTKSQIVNNALKIVSKKGINALTARELGKKLGTTPRPIFTLYDSMEELQNEVRKEAMNHFESMELNNTNEIPSFKQIGMKMILFAIKEPKLFQLLFMQENKNSFSFEDMYKMLGNNANKCIETIENDYSLNNKEAQILFENMWIYTYGISVLCATKACNFNEEMISEKLTIQFNAVMLLIKNNRDKL